MTTPPDAVQMPPLPVAAYWIPKAEQFCFPYRDGGRPFAKAWEPLVRLSDAQAHAAQQCAELEAKLAVADARVAVLFAELQHIAIADIRKWEQGYQTTDEFMTWAQSRALAALTPKEHP